MPAELTGTGREVAIKVLPSWEKALLAEGWVPLRAQGLPWGMYRHLEVWQWHGPPEAFLTFFLGFYVPGKLLEHLCKTRLFFFFFLNIPGCVGLLGRALTTEPQTGLKYKTWEPHRPGNRKSDLKVSGGRIPSEGHEGEPIPGLSPRAPGGLPAGRGLPWLLVASPYLCLHLAVFTSVFGPHFPSS